ncbi:glyoxal oxidase [Serendipita vermifera MAFF 305830]|uniref:Glyoxal oxidase n=1 Tax=Serendipita vermifera MAFF 305830 TaxID=933852 RepID=A0A0C2W837_SERVB|nr:glyoxal oxidase [Serendipita vermifera MAFF 305830]
MACAGDGQTICGGANRLTVYKYGAAPISSSSSAVQTTTTTTRASTTTTTTTTTSAASPSTTGPTTLQAYNGWTSKGCYVDSVAARSLPVAMGVTGGPAAMTVEKCVDACKAANYPVAGLEYSAECYCGNTLPPQVATDGRCNMKCNGSNNFCGGPNGLNVYQYGTVASSSTTATTSSTRASTTTTSTAPTTTGPTTLQTYGNWQSQGCWSDDPAQRSLSFTANVNGANTPQKCMDACYAAGYNYAGMEYGAECYCGTSVLNGGSLQADSGCNMICQADNTHYCGGPYRLNLYKYNGTVPPPTNNPPPTGGVGPVTTGLPAGWRYDACYVDGTYGRIQSYAVGPSATNSAANCIAACTAQGFKLAGMEYSNECYCSNALQNGAVKAAADTQCSMACSGDAAHACGAANRISLYASVATFPTYPPPTPKKTNLPGQYKYAGCYMEPGGGQTIFKYQITDKAAMSVEMCANQCSAYGYGAAALEFGDECWCGDASMVAANTVAPETECNAPCVGSPADICGGVARFTLYSWDFTTTPLYVWNTPANKGRYELLIGGIVIPLIATLGLNNKVTFLEKGGTGAPNSTGAYELDYTLANDYKKAWREMHVSSDVFCAANLVLPDRKGRLLSIGGWSLESTEGIRLYTPSGSLGVNGTTDWEEHWDQIHLQEGRWYPGAMTMANGSIFVIGGEEGSNGAPVPSIEILPKPAGGPTFLTMDWLLRTDPNNLYPFSFVLPGGGIFVLYYNEARILNEATFATTKTLPTIPGQVNAVGGRTYPLEGTAMVLPQTYPYTDPFEVIACGGSAFGQALDNCVSIQPEVANPTWVVERMPSKRVMTIMAALPDGTYMIMGGAQQGVAGFGLAINPNLQALLYDPSKPRHQRISILGTTSVARMYHSEAILLHDGRVLVTGSDPEDNGQNPQEYRMEVYLPPYLTSGLVQPTYTITTRDWVYGGTYNIVVNLRQGTTAGMRVSLLGAVSTTHGNSFGQRTFFPKFTCAGNTCTITAPPNAHICPPGWFQLFVLDGPTPSYSQWVRIGGDPAALGNWPNYPGFTLPGVGAI